MYMYTHLQAAWPTLFLLSWAWPSGIRIIVNRVQTLRINTPNKTNTLPAIELLMYSNLNSTIVVFASSIRINVQTLRITTRNKTNLCTFSLLVLKFPVYIDSNSLLALFQLRFMRAFHIFLYLYPLYAYVNENRIYKCWNCMSLAHDKCLSWKADRKIRNGTGKASQRRAQHYSLPKLTMVSTSTPW